METVSIVMGLLRAVGTHAIRKLSLKNEKHEKIAMLAVSLTLSVDPFQKNYQITSFQMKNIH